MVNATLGAWPGARNSGPGIVAQFGEGRAELAGWALTTRDPLADAVAEEIRAGGRRVRAKLHRGIEHGLARVDEPPPGLAAPKTSWVFRSPRRNSPRSTGTGGTPGTCWAWIPVWWRAFRGTRTPSGSTI